MQKLNLQEAIQLHATKKLVGVFEMSNADYHAAPGLSKSSLDNINESPFYYKWKVQNPEDLKESFIFGSAYHCQILEPHLFETLFYKTKTQPRDPKVDEQGRLPLSETNLEKITEMVKVINSNPKAKRLTDGWAETSFFWTDETGIQCKCKTDIITPAGIVVDLKTCQSIAPKEFSKTIHERRYQVQGAWILDGIGHALKQSGQNPFPVVPDSFVLLAQEKSEPFRWKSYQLGAASLGQGEEMYKANLATYARSVTTNQWPDLGDDIEEIECPVWSFK